MANPEHVKILKQGVETWNKWRNEKRLPYDLTETNLQGEDLTEADLKRGTLWGADLRGAKLYRARIDNTILHRTNFRKADLTGANLTIAMLRESILCKAILHKTKLHRANLHSADVSEADLSEADLSEADLRKAKLNGANLNKADLREANLRKAELNGANLTEADLEETNLRKAELIKADLHGAKLRRAMLSKAKLQGAKLHKVNLRGACMSNADLSEADLYNADLSKATLVETILTGATLTECEVYGVSAWNLKGGKVKEQKSLRVTPPSEAKIRVDDLEVAQFVYLLLNNDKIRNVIDTIGEKGVLILGRFTPERKAILDAIRDKLREFEFVPMMFDFDKPENLDFTGTIKTLAGMSRFIIADITNPKSAPLELQAAIPDYMVPLIPIIEHGEEPFAMFVDLQQKYEWVLDVREYPDADALLKKMEAAIVRPALEKSKEMLIKRASGIRKRRIEEWQ